MEGNFFLNEKGLLYIAILICLTKNCRKVKDKGIVVVLNQSSCEVLLKFDVFVLTVDLVVFP